MTGGDANSSQSIKDPIPTSVEPMHPTLTRMRFLRRAAPFMLGVAAAFGLAAVPPYPPQTDALVAAGMWTVLVVLLVAILPWHRIPQALHPIPALAMLPSIAALNYADEQAVSVYAPLAVLPVIWIALFSSRSALVLALVGVAAMFLVPVLALGDFYSTTEWKMAVLWTVAAAVLGLATEGLVRRVRHRIELEVERAEEHAERAEQSRVMLETARGLAASLTQTAAREAICVSARDLAKADFAVLLEPADRGDLAPTGSVGLTIEPPRILVGREPSGAVAALTSRTARFVEDARSDPTLSQKHVEEMGVVSVHFEPVQRGDVAIGVLVVGWFERVEASPLRDDLLGAMGAHAAMAIERARLMDHLESAAKTDELTGLPNRRGWDDEITRELARARRSGEPLCVAVLDLDHFKRVNDILGHPAGDRLLKESAAAWRSAIRLTDVLARHGGEEFALALPACGVEDAIRLVERLRSSTPAGQTVSAGIAQWDGLESAIAIYARADAALYEAKRAGRDRVTLATA